MIELASIGAAHASAIAQLASRPDVVRFGEHEPQLSPSVWSNWLGPPDPHLAMCIGAWDDRRLVGVARLSLRNTRRRLHGAKLDLLASAEREGDLALDALVGATVDACDRWLQVLRIELRCAAGHARIEGLFAAHGFVPEARLTGSLRTGRALGDEVALARVREDVTIPEPLSTSLRIPPRRTLPVPVRVRPVRFGDGPRLAHTMSDPSVVWGTLQLPFQRPERWDERLALQKPTRTIFLVAEVGEELVGAGALTLSELPRRAHTAVLGMHVGTPFQGAGVGRAIMRGLLEKAAERRIARVELTVYPDNVRAVRLYESAGFALEGRSRCSTFRDGSYADDLMMARVTSR